MPIGPQMTDIKTMGDEPINDITASVDELMAETSAAAEQAAAATQTFRGRSMEELIPRIREELGSDAVVVRSGSGLSGGFLGFFQKRHVEVEARAPLAHERADGDLSRNDRATVEGLAAPAIKALIDQAHPFAAQLASAQLGAADRLAATDQDAAPVAASASTADPLSASAGLYGPQPNFDAMREASAAVLPALEAQFVPDAEAGDRLDDLAAAAFQLAVAEPADPLDEPALADDDAEPVVAGLVAPVAAPLRSPGVPVHAKDAARVRGRLVEAGLSGETAADIVGEAVDHFLPFASGRPLDVHVRTVLAGRLGALSDLGPGSRTLAFVGAAGAGKTSAAANLAVVYAAAGRRVTAIVLGDESDGRDLAKRLAPLGIAVHVAGTGERASELIARARPDLTVVDICDSADPATAESLRSDLASLDPDEVHLALPATLSATAASEQHDRQRALGVTHLCLTHADATAHPGAPIGLALDRDLPVSYLCTRATVEPADASVLAARLLP